MSVKTAGYLDTLDARVAAMADACTRCGKCVEACPMPEPARIDVSDPKAVIGGVLDVLRTGAGPEFSEQWAQACTGSGFCLSACDYGVNPRFMLAMARRVLKKRQTLEARREKGKDQFKAMTRGVRVLSRLQLPPELLERLDPSSHPKAAEPPDLIFYTGCNLLKTPHIGLLCLDVLDRLDVRYEVYGGPANCCGILQMRGGDDENAMRQGLRTIERFAETKTSEVLSWCPTCQIQFGETALPIHDIGAGNADPAFDMTMFAVYLARRLEELRPLFTHRVDKRVALHEHPGSEGVTESVVALLSAIPGVEVVDLGQPRIGYTLNSLVTIPERRREMLAKELQAAEDAGVTTLAGVYHSDHREIVAHHGQWSFEVVNFMEIIGEAMGFKREDIFKRLKTMRDVDAILADSQDMIERNGLDAEEARQVVLSDMLGEEILPIDRREHARYFDAD